MSFVRPSMVRSISICSLHLATFISSKTLTALSLPYPCLSLLPTKQTNKRRRSESNVREHASRAALQGSLRFAGIDIGDDVVKSAVAEEVKAFLERSVAAGPHAAAAAAGGGVVKNEEEVASR